MKEVKENSICNQHLRTQNTERKRERETLPSARHSHVDCNREEREREREKTESIRMNQSK